MIPDPMHPAVVHFPVVFAVILPIAAIVALVLFARGRRTARTWALPVLLAVGLAASSFVAVRTGETQEDRVEDVVGDAPMHRHEEAAERFLLLSSILAGIALVGFARGSIGTAARLLTTAGALAVAFAGYQVGHSGGELVYRHGAANAYTVDAGPAAIAATTMDEADDEEDDDD